LSYPGNTQTRKGKNSTSLAGATN